MRSFYNIAVRIIAGALGGRRYKAKPRPGVKPISGRIKQSVFDIVKGMLPGATVLDLFAGTGAVGIEALSRGAAFAFFVDKDTRNVREIERILAQLKLNGKAHPGDALNDLSWVGYRAGVSQFDFIYLGPPYRDSENKPLALSTPALARVAEAGLLAPGGLLALQHHVREQVQAPEALEPFRRMQYGDTCVDFFRWK